MTWPIVVLLALLLPGCAAPMQSRVGLPWSLMDEDRGDLSGVWRQVRSNQRDVRSGYMLTIDLSIGTFAVQKGCTATGGVLRPAGGASFRIEHYNTGFAAAGCPPWRSSPALAPFDQKAVQLVRRGSRLTAVGGGATAEFIRIGRG